jgi:hypothetical protein
MKLYKIVFIIFFSSYISIANAQVTSFNFSDQLAVMRPLENVRLLLGQLPSLLGTATGLLQLAPLGIDLSPVIDDVSNIANGLLLGNPEMLLSGLTDVVPTTLGVVLDPTVVPGVLTEVTEILGVVGNINPSNLLMLPSTLPSVVGGYLLPGLANTLPVVDILLGGDMDTGNIGSILLPSIVYGF